MVGVRAARAAAYLRVAFARPMFDWQNLPRQFFEAIYDTLSPMLAVTADDFSVRVSNSLNEVAARYDLFGGPSAVVLTAKDLSFEFPNLVRSDYGLAAKIAESVEQRPHSDFAECGRASMRLTLNEHLNVLAPGNADDYLSRYTIPSVESTFAQTPSLQQYGAVFSATEAERQWQARCLVERSEALNDALFLTREVTLLRVDEDDATASGLALIWEVIDTCARALDLEMSHE